MGPYLYRLESARVGADWLKFSNAPKAPPPAGQLGNEIREVIECVQDPWLYRHFRNSAATSDRYYAETSESLMWAFYVCQELRMVRDV